MNSKHFIPAFLIFSAAFTPLRAQGPLTPGGPPAPTMKTLDQLEPRTAINVTTTPGNSESLFRITAAGSYYLTGNVLAESGKAGIEVAASNVTVDLMGFTLQGVSGSLDGIRVGSGTFHNIAVRNGTVTGFSGAGIELLRASPGKGALVEEVRVSSNTAGGIRVYAGAVIRACTVTNNGNNGIGANFGTTIINCVVDGNNNGTGIQAGNDALVLGCTARQNGQGGINTGSGSTVKDCTASSNIGSGGIAVGSGSTVTKCTASGNGGSGISALDGSTVSGNTTRVNTGDGIGASHNSRIADNTCDRNGVGGNSTAGVHVTGSGNRIENNNVTNNARGIDVDSGANVIIKNTASQNTGANYDIVANNVYGEIVDRRQLASAAVTGSAAPSSSASTDPLANFAF